MHLHLYCYGGHNIPRAGLANRVIKAPCYRLDKIMPFYSLWVTPFASCLSQNKCFLAIPLQMQSKYVKDTVISYIYLVAL